MLIENTFGGAVYIDSSINGYSVYVTSTYNSTQVTSGGSLTWGSITGTISSQTDLQTALNGKTNTKILAVISANTTAPATANTDYVYLVSGTTTVTLPTAVGNTSLYTVKRVGSGVVTVATTSAQTIDGSASAPINVQYTSLSLVSDGANWNIL